LGGNGPDPEEVTGVFGNPLGVRGFLASSHARRREGPASHVSYTDWIPESILNPNHRILAGADRLGEVRKALDAPDQRKLSQQLRKIGTVGAAVRTVREVVETISLTRGDPSADLAAKLDQAGRLAGEIERDVEVWLSGEGGYAGHVLGDDGPDDGGGVADKSLFT
jgi:hypothetical protein